MLKRLIWLAMDYPKSALLLALLITLVFGIQFPRIHIDTDPENMLPADQADRVLYKRAKQEFGIHDLIMLGITDETGMFRTEALARVARVVERLLGIDGVITADLISLTTTDDVRASGGLLKVQPVMKGVPEQAADLEALRIAISDNPLFQDKLASRDGSALAIYIPIERKDQAARIGEEVRIILDEELAPSQRYHLAGLPIAEDSFGIEMFRQMGIVSPASGGLLFVLLWLVFRKLTLVLPVMVVAMFTVVWGMGLLIGMGYTVHIMSSMIPVFLMPIAVLDSVHVLSDFYDRYPQLQDRRRALRESIEALYTPMLYTSVTSAAGFASLMLADIPPVQVFGAFVAFGILAAFLLTIIIVPASIVLIREDRLQAVIGYMDARDGWFGGMLRGFGRFAFSRAVPVALAAALILGLGFLGVSRTVVNDNPVAWFPEDHELRVADRVMNRRFGGTYMAYLLIEGEQPGAIKRPEVMTFLEGLQHILEADPKVGKTSSLADVVKQVSYVVHDADPQYRRIPERVDELAQYLFLYETAGGVGDLDNLVDYGYRVANIWVQMRTGDNLDMARVADRVAEHLRTEPPPPSIHVRWSGLTYINKVWQDQMVVGMAKAVLGGFVAVFVLMTLLFRSLSLGFLSMLPLTFAIILSYGLAAFMGKEYDMPMAVCSALTLGLSIDFAIHFVQRYRSNLARLGGDLGAANDVVFGETARAIVRNALVIAVGFSPMVLSPLGPYQTVGVFFALLMVFSALTALGLLPGLLKLTHGRLWQAKTT
ncbi:efflux RND transporter permease subunit [Candidatus Thiosymbion oneisti]|uniref:efflux RND transporter permease subunit n=1 Tax=Candidatus Thiosymbion oneisti TaxID=589554 RepID=UPI0013FD9FE8|nr:MMPL family transporter [Candidatus Thiosymbion oneisti]